MAGNEFIERRVGIMERERRNTSRIGRQRRGEFEASLQRLRELGLPNWAVQCYGRAARIAGQLPHELLCRVGEWTANQMLGANPTGNPSGSLIDPEFPPDGRSADESVPSAAARKRGRAH
jgi:hypothetical protein